MLTNKIFKINNSYLVKLHLDYKHLKVYLQSNNNKVLLPTFRVISLALVMYFDLEPKLGI